jgi:O-antigen/teichoic acid export membrane protein
VTAVFAVLIWEFASADARSVLILFALVLPAVALNLRWTVLGVRGAKSVAAGNIASSVLLLLTVPLLVHGTGDAGRVPLLQVAAELTYSLVILAAVARRFGLIVPRIELGTWISTLRQSLPLMLNSLVRAASFSADVVIVGLILGTRSLGIYGAASKPVLFVTGVVGLFSIAFLSSYSGATSAVADLLFRRALRMLCVAALVVAACLSAGAPIVTPLLFGDAYGAGVAVLALLAWRIPITAFGTPYGTVLIARGRQGILLRNSIVAAVVNVVANVAFVLFFGMIGAAGARIVSALVSTLLNYRSTIRLGLLRPLAVGPRLLAPAAWTQAARQEAGGSG